MIVYHDELILLIFGNRNPPSKVAILCFSSVKEAVLIEKCRGGSVKGRTVLQPEKLDSNIILPLSKAEGTYQIFSDSVGAECDLGNTVTVCRDREDFIVRNYNRLRILIKPVPFFLLFFEDLIFRNNNLSGAVSISNLIVAALFVSEHSRLTRLAITRVRPCCACANCINPLLSLKLVFCATVVHTGTTEAISAAECVAIVDALEARVVVLSSSFIVMFSSG